MCFFFQIQYILHDKKKKETRDFSSSFSYHIGETKHLMGRQRKDVNLKLDTMFITLSIEQ